MNKKAQVKVIASVSMDIADHEVRIEKLSADDDRQATVRISTWKTGKILSEPVMLSEEQLIELLHKAAHAEVVSHGFAGKLREKIEI
ncbi:MAG: hypothetical protein AB1531_02455 [Chloroflexota bacterium]